jgi:hypothetical protein
MFQNHTLPESGRNGGGTNGGGGDGGGVVAGSIDFVLAWDAREELSTSQEAYDKRRVYESNLRKEGLVVELLEEEPKGMNFVKITAPEDVLKRYAEILKLRLPMKTVSFLMELFFVFLGVGCFFASCLKIGY